MQLTDNYSVKGVDEAEFRATNAEFAEKTKDFVCRGTDIQLLSLCNIKSIQKPGYAIFYILSKENIEDFMNGSTLKAGMIPREVFGEELLAEMAATTEMAAIINGEKYVISDIALLTLTARARISGENTFNRQNLVRNLHFADAIYSSNENIHIVYREEQIVTKPGGDPVTVKKIFGGLGPFFTPCRQTVLADIVDGIAAGGYVGPPEVTDWYIDHMYTNLSVNFPKKAEDVAAAYKLPNEIIPGVIMYTSDIGYASVSVKGVYRRKGHSGYVTTDEVSYKHCNNLTVEKVLKEAKAKIFDKVTNLPATLANLMGVSLLDYSKVDLSTMDGQVKNMEAVRNMYDTVIKKFICKPTKIAKNKGEELLEALMGELNPEIPYTMYDIAYTFLGVAERITAGLNPMTLDQVRKICGSIPYELEKMGKAPITPSEDDDTLVLASE